MMKPLLALVLLATACAAPSGVDDVANGDAGIEVEDKRPGRAPIFSDTRTATHTAKVNLVMTVHNGPALETRNRKIEICRSRSCKTARGRSSLVVWVAPGTYTATMTASGVTRNRTFTAMANGTSDIVVAMD